MESRNSPHNRIPPTEQANSCGPTASPSQATPRKLMEGSMPPIGLCKEGTDMPSSQPQVTSCGREARALEGIEVIKHALREPSRDEDELRREPSGERADGITDGRLETELRTHFSHGIPKVAGADDRRSGDLIKRAVSDYVAQLLTPLYKTRKIQKDDFKAIVKKSTAKVSSYSDMVLVVFLNLKNCAN